MAQTAITSAYIGVLTLTDDNYRIWNYSIHAFAEEQDISQHIRVIAPIPEAGEMRQPTIKKQAQAGGLILSTITPEVLMVVGGDIADCTPMRCFSASKINYQHTSHQRSTTACSDVHSEQRFADTNLSTSTSTAIESSANRWSERNILAMRPKSHSHLNGTWASYATVDAQPDIPTHHPDSKNVRKFTCDPGATSNNRIASTAYAATHR